MCFGGGPLEVGTEEEAEKLTSQNEKDSANGNIPRNFWFIFVLFYGVVYVNVVTAGAINCCS